MSGKGMISSEFRNNAHLTECSPTIASTSYTIDFNGCSTITNDFSVGQNLESSLKLGGPV